MPQLRSSSAARKSNSDLRITPYTRPKDVLVWNRDACKWLTIDTRNELEPTVEWLRDAIHRRCMVRSGQRAEIYLANEAHAVEEDKPLDYHTFGKLSENKDHDQARSIGAWARLLAHRLPACCVVVSQTPTFRLRSQKYSNSSSRR